MQWEPEGRRRKKQIGNSKFKMWFTFSYKFWGCKRLRWKPIPSPNCGLRTRTDTWRWPDEMPWIIFSPGFQAFQRGVRHKKVEHEPHRLTVRPEGSVEMHGHAARGEGQATNTNRSLWPMYNTSSFETAVSFGFRYPCFTQPFNLELPKMFEEHYHLTCKSLEWVEYHFWLLLWKGEVSKLWPINHIEPIAHCLILHFYWNIDTYPHSKYSCFPTLQQQTSVVSRTAWLQSLKHHLDLFF